MAAALKCQVDALVAQISDKKEGQAALENLAKLAEENGAILRPSINHVFLKTWILEI